ncbi:hypothetical protein [Microbacterium aquimaris]|uniref:Uncharacterized protein n=1 Tax=Microbacterium aquimaris TaxID=459816 RepID=A0ABU5N9D8_9MICO|nr:hypothetical protein [Microbacterium aquimaris]MDZ8162666.1 hypothetical protein [Microbacterium aquimaris]
MDSSPIPAPPTGPAPSSRAEDSAGSHDLDLVSRLEVIEAQPLAGRADAYASLHDELAARLDADVTGRAARS